MSTPNTLGQLVDQLSDFSPGDGWWWAIAITGPDKGKEPKLHMKVIEDLDGTPGRIYDSRQPVGPERLAETDIVRLASDMKARLYAAIAMEARHQTQGEPIVFRVSKPD